MSKRQQQSLLHVLCEKYPLAFSTDTAAIRPLAVGIGPRLVAALPEYRPKLIHRTLCDYTSRLSYQRALLRCGQRFGLFGEPAGMVSKEAKERAQERLAQSTLTQANGSKAVPKTKSASCITGSSIHHRFPILRLNRKRPRQSV